MQSLCFFIHGLSLSPSPSISHSIPPAGRVGAFPHPHLGLSLSGKLPHIVPLGGVRIGAGQIETLPAEQPHAAADICPSDHVVARSGYVRGRGNALSAVNSLRIHRVG